MTTPSPASVRIALPWRGIPGPVNANGTSRSRGSTSRSASEPMKPVSSLQHQPSPASIGLRSSERSLPYRWKQTSSRSVSRAPSPAGFTPLLEQRVPDGAGIAGRDQELHPVLARVAGAADEHVGAGHAEPRRTHPLGELAHGEPLHRRAGVWTLNGQHRVVGERVLQVRVEIAGVVAEPGQIALVVRGVGDGEVALVVEPVGEQVVQHAAVLAAEDRVLGAADGELRHVVGQQPLEEGLGVRPARLDLAHVGDVEDAGVGAHRHVLLADPLVLHRHLPAGERHDARPGRLVAVVQRRAAEGVGGGRQAVRG